MKRILLVLLVFALMVVSFIAGELHAVYDSIIWTVDCYDPCNPDASKYDIYDQRIFIELDGQIWEHGMFQC